MGMKKPGFTSQQTQGKIDKIKHINFMANTIFMKKPGFTSQQTQEKYI